ncbi:TadE/TadG family type IV pilus assembly protein [Methylorubrum sp. SB2]|uniref:TadE/TadG family type IV pilus assembly protein n=1 Tax=Methylorubrum subtropicum TaxID=3138812 RepID=UPI00313EB0F8
MSPSDAPRGARRRFLRDEGGAYAIEFAFFGSLLIAVMLILIQYAVVHLARQNLNASLHVATRALLTGSFQNANGPQLTPAKSLENLRAMMCNGSGSPVVFFKCENLKVDVQIVTKFDDPLWKQSALDPDSKNWRTNFGTTYKCPGKQSIAVVRAAVKLPLIAPLFLKIGMGSFKGGAALLQSAAVFKVEPFESNLTGGC